MKLRPYQEQFVSNIRLQYQLGNKSVLAVLPTGGGKTVCFSHITEQAIRKGNRVLILVHRRELLDQATKSLPKNHGFIPAKLPMDLSHPVQVASVQTLARRLHTVPKDFFNLVIIDEAHHTNAGTWCAVVEHLQSAYLLGVTATPIRLDGKGLGSHYQSMVEGPSASWLTDNSYLAQAKVYAPPGFNASGLRKRMGDFIAKEAEHRVGAIMGDCIKHYEKYLPGKTAIAFCCSIAHAEAVARMFVSAGIPAASIDGTMDGEQRRDLLQALSTGRIKVLTNCALIGEGLDVPSVGGCILLRPTASTSLHLQMIGRCLRPSAGKPAAIILDHVGNTLRLGHHLEDREWTLDGEKKKDREKAPSVKVCPVCFAAMASQARECMECGHTFTAEPRDLKQVDGELVELNRQLSNGDPIHVRSFNSSVEEWLHGWTFGHIYSSHQWKQLGDDQHFPDQENKKVRARCLDTNGKPWSVALSDLKPDLSRLPLPSLRRREQNNAQTLNDLRQIAESRGYKRGWAERVYQARLAKRYGI